MLRRNDSQDEDSEDDIRWALIKRARQSEVPHQRLQDWMEQNGQGLIEATTSTLVVDPPALQYDQSENSSHGESQSEETVETVGTDYEEDPYEEDPLAAETWSDFESDSMELPDDGSQADDMTTPNDDSQVHPIELSLNIDETVSQSIAAVTINMKAHLVVVSGDMPAISKGIGAKYPCRWCTMPAIRSGPPGVESGKYYLTTKCQGLQSVIDYHNLPIRNHITIMQTVQEIRACASVGNREEMQKETGINDQSVFSIIGSINFPWSFSVDTMHLLYENIMNELLGLFEGNLQSADGNRGRKEERQESNT